MVYNIKQNYAPIYIIIIIKVLISIHVAHRILKKTEK